VRGHVASPILSTEMKCESHGVTLLIYARGRVGLTEIQVLGNNVCQPRHCQANRSVLEKGETRSRVHRSFERGASGRWHIHCAIELPANFVAEKLVRDCWQRLIGSMTEVLFVMTYRGWIDNTLKGRQRSEFDELTCMIPESLHHSIVDAS
jgi:hypothetical protein